MNYKNANIYTEQFRFERGAFSVEDGKFCNVLGQEAPDAVDLGGAYVIPGLIDVHTHGNSGADFSDGDVAGVEKMAKYLAKNGVTSAAESGGAAERTAPDYTVVLDGETVSIWAQGDTLQYTVGDGALLTAAGTAEQLQALLEQNGAE